MENLNPRALSGEQLSLEQLINRAEPPYDLKDIIDGDEIAWKALITSLESEISRPNVDHLRGLSFDAALVSALLNDRNLEREAAFRLGLGLGRIGGAR